MWFDTKRGLVDRIEGETSQGHGFDGLGVTRLALGDIGRVDPNTALALALEMADYFAVKQEYSELVEQAGKEPRIRASCWCAARRFSMTCAAW